LSHRLFEESITQRLVLVEIVSTGMNIATSANDSIAVVRDIIFLIEEAFLKFD